ncbi:hypothetical protein NFI96_009873, partial [Prochilodus magdalenae]
MPQEFLWSPGGTDDSGRCSKMPTGGGFLVSSRTPGANDDRGGCSRMVALSIVEEGDSSRVPSGTLDATVEHGGSSGVPSRIPGSSVEQGSSFGVPFRKPCVIQASIDSSHEGQGKSMSSAVGTCRSKNLALYGKATQSDLIGNPWAPFGHAYNAIDGNSDPDYNHGSCTTTKSQQNPWWRVDLLDEYTVTSITITNRGDCCPERINGAEIHIGNSLLNNGNSNPRAGEITSIPAGRSITLKFEKGISGRYVNVVLPGDKRVLTLCEVEVYGYPTPH